MTVDEAVIALSCEINEVQDTVQFHALHHALGKVREAIAQERGQYIRRIAELEAINEDHRRTVADAYMQRQEASV